MSRHESVLEFVLDGAGGVSAVHVSGTPFDAVTFTRVRADQDRE